MRYSSTFPKTLKQNVSGADSINHQLLVKGGFIDQLMAGSFTLLPLGWRVYFKIEQIIREELDKVGCQEMLMPLLHPRAIWDQTGRWSDPDVKEIMYQFKDIHDKEYGLSFTHEEIVMHLLGKFVHSYKDLPVLLYHFSTKFRNELRAKSGILRGREFIMKDLYSAHVSEEDMWKWYEVIKDSYVKIFKRVGLEVKVVEAAGGVFTKGHTHEFQVLAPTGEDTIYYCTKCDFAQNKEIYSAKEGEKCPKCGGEIKTAAAIEVGNIFPLGTKYAKDMGVNYKDQDGGDQVVWFASYGIGMTRLIGTLVEVFHDDKGIIWPEKVAPYRVNLLSLNEKVLPKAEEVYKELKQKGVEVLFDDRAESAGVKLNDADLLGIPWRVVVSEKTLEKESVEVKKRNSSEAELVKIEEFLKVFKEILAPTKSGLTKG